MTCSVSFCPCCLWCDFIHMSWWFVKLQETPIPWLHLYFWSPNACGIQGFQKASRLFECRSAARNDTLCPGTATSSFIGRIPNHPLRGIKQPAPEGGGVKGDAFHLRVSAQLGSQLERYNRSFAWWQKWEFYLNCADLKT